MDKDTQKYSDQTEPYALPRGGQEEQRLKDQHSMFVDYAGGLVHESIPPTEITHVADIVAGISIWLLAVAERLNSPNSFCYAFDISASQYPKAVPDNIGHIKYVVHDMKKPFPAEYHQRFDLVNVRLVVQALRGADVREVVSNLADLLRPGGYLQWQDVQWDDVKAYPQHHDMDRVNNIILAHMLAHGLSGRIPELVESAMREVGFEEVKSKKSWHDESSTRRQSATAAVNAAEGSMLPKAIETVSALVGAHVDTMEASQRVTEMKARLDELSNHGYQWELSVTVVVGKRQSS